MNLLLPSIRMWLMALTGAWQSLTYYPLLIWDRDKTSCCLLLVSSLVRSPGMTNINNWLVPTHTLWHGHRWSDTNMHNRIKVQKWCCWWFLLVMYLLYFQLIKRESQNDVANEELSKSIKIWNQCFEMSHYFTWSFTIW